MADAIVYPASYDSTNYSYASVDSSYPLSNAVGKGSDNSTYAQWTMKTGSGAETYVYYIFDLSEIPSNATIDSVSCTAKGYISTTSTWYVSSYTMQMYSGSTAKGSSVSLSTSASAQSISCGTWTRDELDDCRIRIYAVRGYFSTSTSRTMRFYGAALTVTYTVNDVTYTITASASSGGNISPDGTFTVSKDDSIEFTMTPDDGYSLKSLTINDEEVQTTENTSTSLENGISLFHCEDLTDAFGLCTVTNNGVVISSDISKFGNNSLYFDQSSYLILDLGDATAYTIEFWAYVQGDNTSGWYPTIFSSESSTNAGGTYMHVDDGSYGTYPVCRANASGSASNNGGYGSTVITRNDWHHIALCIDGSSHYFFLDGELQYTVTQSSPNDYTKWYLGGLKGSSGMVGGCYYLGYIDELLISSVCKWTSNFDVPTLPYSNESNTYYTYLKDNIDSNLTVYALFYLLNSNPPIITIGTPDKTRISDEAGYNECICIFTADQDLTEWEARATLDGTTPARGVGLLVESGTNLLSGIYGTISVLDSELTNGDGEYTISVYGKNSSGVWSDE